MCLIISIFLRDSTIYHSTIWFSYTLVCITLYSGIFFYIFRPVCVICVYAVLINISRVPRQSVVPLMETHVRLLSQLL